MKKMNKIYEAPKAEVIEMLNTVVVVMSDTQAGPVNPGEDPIIVDDEE
jgi:hypothetical protein